VQPDNSKIHYLVDTGSAVSILPNNLFPDNKLQNDHKTLHAANNSLIETFGTTTQTIFINGQSYIWKFTIAQVSQPILGADFLRHFDFLVDCNKRRIFLNPNKTNTVHNPETYNSNLTFIGTILQNPNSTITHKIITNSHPCHAKVRQLPPDKLKSAKQHFKQLINDGVIRPSSSPWASALMMTKKKNGEWRCCGDYRQLNSSTIPDAYPLPLIRYNITT